MHPLPTLAEASRLIRERLLSPVALTEQCLDRITRYNPLINAFITVTADTALAEARAAAAEINAGGWRGPLHGIPLALKDLIDTAGIVTTAASAVYQDRVPVEDAMVVKQLRAAGAVFLGKLNLHEFAYGGTCVPSHFGPVRNPWNTSHIAGGSSGGSGAAVAAGLCLGALGTDTAASIRHPAAYCGITGLKATYGLVSTSGVIPLSWSLDHVGPLARTAEDTALILDSLIDPSAVTTRQSNLSYYDGLKEPVCQLRIGVVREPYFEDLDPGIGESVMGALHILEGLTAGLRDTTLPYNNLLMTIASAEAYAYHRAMLGATPELYQPMTRQRLEIAAGIPSADYILAMRELQALRRDADKYFGDLDLLVTPTTALAPIPIECGALDPPLPSNGTPIEFRNTHMFDVLGLPAISIPCGFTPDGLPVGLQIAGPRHGERRVLALAHAFQQATSWHDALPPLP
jgi:aspartyl-tRNA(Asn)/glutamyl-tRNA(Gln) amidotransferase subunit A